MLCALGTVFVLLLAPATALAAKHAHAHRATLAPFHPRIGRAMGLVPPAGGPPEVAIAAREPVVYHGGSVMRNVTVHTVFWAPAGYPFGGSPGSGAPGYVALVQQFLTDAAQDSGSTANDFSVLAQYGDTGSPGGYALGYSAGADSITDTDPYPALSAQCLSPSGFATCVTDLEIERELDHVISQNDPTGRGLHDLWMIFLPPNVDECTQAGSCGTNAFAGYHSLFDLGNGPTVYAVVIDPLIEGVVHQGADPEGNPDAEMAADVTAHELVEAVTDPEGTGWMDPDGFEVGDKCEAAYGTPLGYAANGSPYNQSLSGHPYLVQLMWSNPTVGCVASGSPAPPPAPAQVNLTQFSPAISGRIGAGQVAVLVTLLRGAQPVATASTFTRADGTWAATLRSVSTRAPMAVGDDRDIITVRYGHGGPASDLITTDSGGNPFTEAGWTGWFDLDYGFAVAPDRIGLAPCGQTGVLAVRVGSTFTAPPVEQCQTETDVSVVSTPPIGLGTPLSMSSTDNRAVWPGNKAGALVRLTIPLGEPNSTPAVNNALIQLTQTGFPTCTADLSRQVVSCSGLIAHARYTLTRRGHRPWPAKRADDGGVVSFGPFAAGHGFAGGEVLVLRNRAGRWLSTLHVARLRVDLQGSAPVVAGGRCEPGDYWGPPVSSPPVGSLVGTGAVAGSGNICPLSGDATGMPSSPVEQTDSFSGGVTQTEVPALAFTSPAQGATLYGPFTALAQPVLGSSPAAAKVTLTIYRRGSRHVVRRVSGVERLQGVRVTHLAVGVYTAVWKLTDTSGDTRTIQTYFVQER
jgi:hypothetical protein